MVEQGDIITVRSISFPVLVVSKNAYNNSGKALVCPIMPMKPDLPFSYHIETDMVKGYVWYDNIRRINISERGALGKGRVSFAKMMAILGMIQSFFDY